MTTSPTKPCKECGGDGYIEYDVPKPLDLTEMLDT